VPDEWVQVSVRARAPGRSVGDEVLSALGVRAEDGLRLRIGGAGHPTLIFLVVEDLASHAKGPAPFESFAAAIERDLLAAAVWLRRLPDGAFEALRDRGISVDIFVGSWVLVGGRRRDPFELSLAAPFLLECGHLGLPITIVTNG
jgi:hypothetical protein